MNTHLSSNWWWSTFVHKPRKGFPTHPFYDNPFYSHREAGNGVHGFDLGTTYAHKWSNANLRTSTLKFLSLVAEDLTYLNQVVMCNETWVHHYDPLTKWESECWKRKNEPHGKKVQQLKLVGKVMPIMFFDHWSPLYQHFVLPTTTINKEYYLKVLKIVQWHVNRKHLELKSQWILHQKDAHLHTVWLVRE